jgi:hypothetical protein
LWCPRDFLEFPETIRALGARGFTIMALADCTSPELVFDFLYGLQEKFLRFFGVNHESRACGTNERRNRKPRMTRIRERRRLARTFGASAETIFFSPEVTDVARNTGILPVSSNGHLPSRDRAGWEACTTCQARSLSYFDHGLAKPISLGAFGFCVFTITALSGCTSVSLYLISSMGFKKNSYYFSALTTNPAPAGPMNEGTENHG